MTDEALRSLLQCPRCGDGCPIMGTAYGQRAICTRCNIRWTRLRQNAGEIPTLEPGLRLPVFRWGLWHAERR